MISVIIPTFNEEHQIAKCVNSILKYPEFDEIIVVDDNSTDNTVQVCRDLGVTVVVKDPSQPKGKSSSMNVGAQHVTNDIVYITDADCFALDIQEAIDMALGGADLVGIPCKIHEDGRLLAKLEAHEYDIALRRIRPWLHRNAESLYSVSGAGFMINAEHMRNNPVPEHIQGEDLYYSVLAHQQGWNIEAASNSMVCTYAIPSVKCLLIQRTRWNKGYFGIVNETGYKRILIDMLPIAYRTSVTALSIAMLSMGRLDLTALVLAIYYGYEYVRARDFKLAAQMMVYRQINFLAYFTIPIIGKTWKVNR